MMKSSKSLPELVAEARANAQTHESRVAEILQPLDGQVGSDAQMEELRAETAKLELSAVETFSLFELLMQHHFRRGPFSRKLKSALLADGQTELANRVHQYYLAINVLKHGTGASYRELQKTPTSLFVVKQVEDIGSSHAQPSTSLIDVTEPGFFDGLAGTILEAHQFLENR